MTQEQRPPNQMPWLVPNITVNDVEKSMEFYAKAFNFIPRGKSLGSDNTHWHGEMQYKDQVIVVSKEGIPGGTTRSPKSNGMPSSMNLYFYCEDIDSIYHQAIIAGAEVKAPPMDTEWGDRIAIVSDLDGYYWVIATAQKKH